MDAIAFKVKGLLDDLPEGQHNGALKQLLFSQGIVRKKQRCEFLKELTVFTGVKYSLKEIKKASPIQITVELPKTHLVEESLEVTPTEKPNVTDALKEALKKKLLTEEATMTNETTNTQTNEVTVSENVQENDMETVQQVENNQQSADISHLLTEEDIRSFEEAKANVSNSKGDGGGFNAKFLALGSAVVGATAANVLAGPSYGGVAGGLAGCAAAYLAGGAIGDKLDSGHVRNATIVASSAALGAAGAAAGNIGQRKFFGQQDAGGEEGSDINIHIEVDGPQVDVDPVEALGF